MDRTGFGQFVIATGIAAAVLLLGGLLALPDYTLSKIDTVSVKVFIALCSCFLIILIGVWAYDFVHTPRWKRLILRVKSLVTAFTGAVVGIPLLRGLERASLDVAAETGISADISTSSVIGQVEVWPTLLVTFSAYFFLLLLYGVAKYLDHTLQTDL